MERPVAPHVFGDCVPRGGPRADARSRGTLRQGSKQTGFEEGLRLTRRALGKFWPWGCAASVRKLAAASRSALVSGRLCLAKDDWTRAYATDVAASSDIATASESAFETGYRCTSVRPT